MRWFILFCALLVTVACAPTQTAVKTEAPPPMITLDRGQNGSAVVLRPGGVLRIMLPGDPASGQGWEVAQLDESVLVQAGHALYVPSADRTLSGGMFYFTFTGAREGITPIRLVYRPAHDREQQPTKVFLTLVTIQP